LGLLGFGGVVTEFVNEGLQMLSEGELIFVFTELIFGTFVLGGLEGREIPFVVV